MKKVGIVPPAKLFETNEFYEDTYTTHNSFCRHIRKNGGIPLGVLPTDAFITDDELSCFDSFVICGGRRIWSYHFQVAEHAIRTGKPILGVCLGMQTIHSYFVVADEAKRRNWQGSLLDLYTQMKKERYYFVEPVEHHWDVHILRDNIEDCKHPIEVLPNTHLHALLNGQTHINGATMHHYRITKPSDRLTVTARTADGTIEGIECGENIIGIQFHPEVDDMYTNVFSFLTK